MIVGFTGTQQGMTGPQLAAVKLVLQFVRAEVGHHGLCIGADNDFHAICKELGIGLEGHPPVDTKKMANLPKSDFLKLWPPAPYLVRDRHIVDAVQLMVATPFGYKEARRSGTWATVRYARDREKPLMVVFPDGSRSS